MSLYHQRSYLHCLHRSFLYTDARPWHWSWIVMDSSCGRFGSVAIYSSLIIQLFVCASSTTIVQWLETRKLISLSMYGVWHSYLPIDVGQLHIIVSVFSGYLAILKINTRLFSSWLLCCLVWQFYSIRLLLNHADALLFFWKWSLWVASYRKVSKRLWGQCSLSLTSVTATSGPRADSDGALDGLAG